MVTSLWLWSCVGPCPYRPPTLHMCSSPDLHLSCTCKSVLTPTNVFSYDASMDHHPLTSLSITHVYYNSADIISYICAYLALVPQALTVIYPTVIWTTREIEILLMFAGQMGCELLNWCLKRWIKEERPSRTFFPYSMNSM